MLIRKVKPEEKEKFNQVNTERRAEEQSLNIRK